MKPDDEMVVKAVEDARKNLKESDCLLPVFIVGNDKELIVMGMPMGEQNERDMIAAGVGMVAKTMGATFVLSVLESYVIDDNKAAKEYYANPGRYKSMSEHPLAKEIIYFSLETSTRNWFAVVPILSGREMGKVEWHEADNVAGRFGNLLGKKPTLN